jgi:hypothetical protein
VSSLYDGGTPGLKKLWRMASVEAHIPVGISDGLTPPSYTPSCTVELQYSINHGTTWVSLGTISETVAGVYRETWYMSGASAEVESASIMYRLVLYSADGGSTPTVKSVSFWYLPEPEPNWVYDLTVGIAERIVLLDGTEDTQDMDAARTALVTYFRNQNIVEFTDMDGNVFDCLIWDFVEDFHVPGKAGEPSEAFMRLSLLEVSS